MKKLNSASKSVRREVNKVYPALRDPEALPVRLDPLVLE
jgi:hypothetical protein